VSMGALIERVCWRICVGERVRVRVVLTGRDWVSPQLPQRRRAARAARAAAGVAAAAASIQRDACTHAPLHLAHEFALAQRPHAHGLVPRAAQEVLAVGRHSL
jgi:hypothetical protein